MKQVFTYKGLEYTYELIRSERRTLAVQVKEDGRVIVRAPKRAASKEIEAFVLSHRDWIVRHVETNRSRPVGEAFSPREKERMREQARDILTAKADYYARIMGVQYHRIFIKEQKTVWGSCSSKGNLNFNWKLILTGPDQLEYVVVHELAHLKEMNHSPAFWKEVEKILPDYRERRKRLKEFRP